MNPVLVPNRLQNVRRHPPRQVEISSSERLAEVHRILTAELERWQPEVVAIEEVFYSVNAKSALKLGQVRGVALLAAAQRRSARGRVRAAQYKVVCRGLWTGKKGAGSVHGCPALESAGASSTRRRGRCAGNRHLSLAHCPDLGSSGGPAMRIPVGLALLTLMVALPARGESDRSGPRGLLQPRTLPRAMDSRAAS